MDSPLAVFYFYLNQGLTAVEAAKEAELKTGEHWAEILCQHEMSSYLAG